MRVYNDLTKPCSRTQKLAPSICREILQIEFTRFCAADGGVRLKPLSRSFFIQKTAVKPEILCYT